MWQTLALNRMPKGNLKVTDTAPLKRLKKGRTQWNSIQIKSHSTQISIAV